MIIDRARVILGFFKPTKERSFNPTHDQLFYAYEAEVSRALMHGKRQRRYGVNDSTSEWGYITSRDEVTWFVPGQETMGINDCACGDKEDVTALVLPGKYYTLANSVHILEWHRSQVPEEEIEKIKAFLVALPTHRDVQ
jgi:hypothetical protein